jgi:hypothetical protein
MSAQIIQFPEWAIGTPPDEFDERYPDPCEAQRWREFSATVSAMLDDMSTMPRRES